RQKEECSKPAYADHPTIERTFQHGHMPPLKRRTHATQNIWPPAGAGIPCVDRVASQDFAHHHAWRATVETRQMPSDAVTSLPAKLLGAHCHERAASTATTTPLPTHGS